MDISDYDSYTSDHVYELSSIIGDMVEKQMINMNFTCMVRWHWKPLRYQLDELDEFLIVTQLVMSWGESEI